MSINYFTVLPLVVAATIASASAIAGGKGKPEPLIIQEQGSFAVGGTVITGPRHFRSQETDTRRADLSR